MLVGVPGKLIEDRDLGIEFVLLPDADSPEGLAARQKAKQEWGQGFDTFLAGFQALHNALEPLVREYTSAPERMESD